MPRLPHKLRVDTIAEALCEFRFSSTESVQLPELVLGKLASAQPWSEFAKVRLPTSEFPASLRALDLNLKYQPSLELRSTNGLALVKIGEWVLSVHRLAPYPGGDDFETEIVQAVEVLFASLQGLRIDRIGLRYINVFTHEEHGVTGISDLNQSISVAGEPMVSPVNLNYIKACDIGHTALVRIATPEFVGGPIAKPFTVLVDVDVHTPSNFSCIDAKQAKDWVTAARIAEKEVFFSLFTERLRESLVESWA